MESYSYEALRVGEGGRTNSKFDVMTQENGS